MPPVRTPESYAPDESPREEPPLVAASHADISIALALAAIGAIACAAVFVLSGADALRGQM